MIRRCTTPAEAAQWLRSRVQGRMQTDSRRVHAGDGFVAWPGGVTDARQFVPDVLGQGAAACLVEAHELTQWPWIHHLEAPALSAVQGYAGLKAACGPIAAAYYEQPSAQLPVVAITGTNGKTSTAWWLAHALQALGQRCALVGTLGVGEPGALQSTGMTTPDPVLLQAQLRQWVDAGVAACAMEASSIGLAEHRLDGTQIRVAVFTNFTQDHLDYHGSMEAYWRAKAALFDWPGLHTAVIHLDDPHGATLAQALCARADLTVWTYSSTHATPPVGARHLHARELTQTATGMRFVVQEAAQTQALDTRMIGTYNVSNVLGVLAVLRAMGHTLSEAVRACQHLPPVPGRMQTVAMDTSSPQPCVVVDYAHTPDAVAQALRALRPLADARGGQLVCVLGCGGDRDPHKRPLMAAAAQRHADRVVLTSDNPRSEDPAAIVQHMCAGLDRPLAAPDALHQELDRAQAIAWAIHHARAEDVVLLAGKGHETHQEVQGVRHPFSDVTHAHAALQQRSAHG